MASFLPRIFKIQVGKEKKSRLQLFSLTFFEIPRLSMIFSDQYEKPFPHDQYEKGLFSLTFPDYNKQKFRGKGNHTMENKIFYAIADILVMWIKNNELILAYKF